MSDEAAILADAIAAMARSDAPYQEMRRQARARREQSWERLLARAENAEGQRDILLKAAQGMYELHKDGVSHQLQLYQREAALKALRDAIAAATGEVG